MLRMTLKFKSVLASLILASGLVLYFSGCTLNPPVEIVKASPTKEANEPDERSESAKTPSETVAPTPANEQGIIHKNCLIRCPKGIALDNIIVDHDAIVLSSNKKTKFADWVAYKSRADYINGPERKRNWAKDIKIDAQFTLIPQDYKGMSIDPYLFDRGHQAPLASFKNHPNWFVLNYLSNITPQKRDLNRGPWKHLESAERKLVKQYGEAYILTGPCYDGRDVIKGPPVKRIEYTVPSGYWKIIALKKGNGIKIVGFLFPQNTPIRDNYCKYQVSLSKIEKSTGLKFFDGKQLANNADLKHEIGCSGSKKAADKHLH